MSELVKIDVFSDGSGTTKNKPAGYGWALIADGNTLMGEGNGLLDTGTNNDAELRGALSGLAECLKLVKEFHTEKPNHYEFDITLCADSKIILGWADGSFRFKQEEKSANYVLLRQLMQRLNAKTRWVKGHSGDKYNERCDALANLGRHGLGPGDQLPGKRRQKPKLRIGKRQEDTITIQYTTGIKVIDLCRNIIEDYDPQVHGVRAVGFTYNDGLEIV